MSSSLLWIGLAVGFVVAVVICAVGDGKATRIIESASFRQLLEKETSKGMKFEANYAPLERVDVLGLHADSFHGANGRKTIVSLDAQDISGWFNPLGLGLRWWEINDLHLKRGTVWLQKTNPTPGEPKGTPPIPWWALFWPYRVELEDVKCDDANVLFKLRDQESGLYHIFLEITPNGRDFEYDGKGGTFKTPMTPTLNLRHVHLLIRKPRLYCPTFVLGDDPDHPEHQLSVSGDAGLQNDRSIRLAAKIDSLSVSPWLPEKLRDHVRGQMSGHLDYHSTGTGLETAQADGSIAIADAVLHQLPAIEQYVKSTGSPYPGADLRLQVCQSDVRYEQGAIRVENLQIECHGVFKVTGYVSISKDKALDGDLVIGLTDAYLKWLPRLETDIFTNQDGDYHTTNVHLSGTSKKPRQDLSGRVVKELKKSPLVAVKLFFNSL